MQRTEEEGQVIIRTGMKLGVENRYKSEESVKLNHIVGECNSSDLNLNRQGNIFLAEDQAHDGT